MNNRYRQAEKFWKENMMDEKVREERHRANQEYLDSRENDISRYWSNANNWLLDLILFVFQTFDNVLKQIPEDKQSSPLYKVISELHQRSVNHAKTTCLLLKGDPIDTAVFQWRSLYEAEVRTTFFLVKRSHSLKEAEKIAERLLRYSELMRKKKFLEDKFIQKTEEEKKEKDNIYRQLSELGNYNWYGHESFEALCKFCISKLQNSISDPTGNIQGDFASHVSLERRLYHITNSVGHLNPMGENYSHSQIRALLIISTAMKLANISKNCLLSLCGINTEADNAGYWHILDKYIAKIEQEVICASKKIEADIENPISPPSNILFP